MEPSMNGSLRTYESSENECDVQFAMNGKNESVQSTVIPEKEVITGILVKLGNGVVVYNLSNALERVRYLINTLSVKDILATISPHKRCVTYVAEAQKVVRGDEKKNMFLFVSSYHVAEKTFGGNHQRKYRERTGIPVIIIGDVTNVKEDQCSFVFICAYINKHTAQGVRTANSLKLLSIYSSSADESNDSSDDNSSTTDSSDDSSSSVSSSSAVYSSANENDEDGNNEKSSIIIKKRECVKPLQVDIKNPLVFLEDGAIDKLPPVQECDIKIPKEDSIVIGYVMHVHEVLISVQGYKDSPALNVDTLLFMEDKGDDKCLQSLGFVYEIIGPVDEPVYCVPFKEGENVQKKRIEQGAQVYISPKPKYTHFVFVNDLLKHKGSDASWKNDVEPPEQFLEYSDDEEERLAKQKLKQASANEALSSSPMKRKSTDENTTQKSNKRKRKIQNGCSSSHSFEINHAVDSNINSLPSSVPQQHQIPPRLPEIQHNGTVPYHVRPNINHQQIAHAVNGIAEQHVSAAVAVEQHPRMQQYRCALPPIGMRPTSPAVIQPPPRMQHYGPAPVMNGHFLPMPPSAFPPNYHFSPAMQPQQQTHFNSAPFQMGFAPFRPPPGQFFQPPQ